VRCLPSHTALRNPFLLYFFVCLLSPTTSVVSVLFFFSALTGAKSKRCAHFQSYDSFSFSPFSAAPPSVFGFAVTRPAELYICLFLFFAFCLSSSPVSLVTQLSQREQAVVMWCGVCAAARLHFPFSHSLYLLRCRTTIVFFLFYTIIFIVLFRGLCFPLLLGFGEFDYC
jgi:hypothetical protein